MILRKSSVTRQLRYLFILTIVTSILFLYYASSSIYVKSTVFQFYRRVGYRPDTISSTIPFNSNENDQLNNENNIPSNTITSNTTTATLVMNSTTSLLKTNDIIDSTSTVQKTTIFMNTTLTATVSTTAEKLSTLSNKKAKKTTVIEKSDHLSSTNSTSSSLNSCPIIPPDLGTRIPINKTAYPIDEIIEFPYIKRLNLTKGGIGKPKSCKARYRVAIIIPYRDRLANLQLFVNHMHPFLNKQQLEYGIYIAEPTKNITFNRGILMNIGYNEAVKDNKDWNCFIFHDVDLLPEDERNIYSCPEVPRHMSSAVSTLGYKIPYDAIFGGVTGFTKEHYIKINGFSNMYFGWGGEDDDLRRRVIKSGLKVSRYPLEIGRYFMAKHKKDKPNPQRFNLLRNSNKRIGDDGITTLKYDVKSIEKNTLFTRFVVYYNQSAIYQKPKS